MLIPVVTVRRVVLIVLTMVAFFGSILEPLEPRFVLEDTYTFKKSSLQGIPNEPLDLGLEQQFCEAFQNLNTKMDIEFSVNIRTLSNRFTNIFQTDDYNSGFRIEINSDGILAALVHSPNVGTDQLVGAAANGVVKAKTLTKVYISVYSNTLSSKIDDGEYVSVMGDFRPTCNRVLIGGGFDSTRTTLGEVQAVFQIQKLKTVLTFGLAERVRDVSRIIFTFLLVCVVWDYRKSLYVGKLRGPK